MSGPSDFVPVFRKRMERSFWREQSYAIAFDGQHNVLGMFLVGQGNENSCPVPVSVAFKQVLGSRKCRPCVAIILAHNHPSGSLVPSYEDIVVTEKFREAGRYLEIELLDHLVITRNGFTSIRRTNPEIYARKGDA